jgi:hypothetical protein
VLCYVCDTLSIKAIILDPSHQVHSRDALSIQSPSHYASNWACPELIYEILTWCLSGVTLSTDDPRLFPWYLGHVCRSWRSVFVSSPRFWDRFSLLSYRIDTGRSITRIQRALALVELCIERTKDHPFSFYLCDTFHADRSDDVYKSLPEANGHFRQLESVVYGGQILIPLPMSFKMRQTSLAYGPVITTSYLGQHWLCSILMCRGPRKDSLRTLTR